MDSSQNKKRVILNLGKKIKRTGFIWFKLWRKVGSNFRLRVLVVILLDPKQMRFNLPPRYFFNTI